MSIINSRRAGPGTAHSPPRPGVSPCLAARKRRLSFVFASFELTFRRLPVKFGARLTKKSKNSLNATFEGWFGPTVVFASFAAKLKHEHTKPRNMTNI